MSDPPQGGDGKVPARAEGSPWGPFSWGFTDVTAIAFVALGLVAGTMRGASPAAFALAGLTYVLVGLGYTELASTYPMAGGAQHFVVRALGDLFGFLAGAALLFDFTVDLALFAVAAAAHLEPILGGAVSTRALAIGVIALVAALQLFGGKRAALVAGPLAAVGLAVLTALVVGGFAFAWDPAHLAGQWQEASATVEPSRFAHGATLVLLSLVGLESIAQVAHGTRRSATMVPRAALTLVFCVFGFGVALSTLAMGLSPWASFANHLPLVSVAGVLPVVGEAAAPVAAVLGFGLLTLAASGALLGIARVVASMGQMRLVASAPGAHKRPVGAVVAFSLLAVGAVAAASRTDDPFAALADLYALGATLACALVLLALVRLRFVDGHTPRPYKLPFNLPWRGRSLPLVALAGLVALALVLSAVLATHRLARIAAPLWLAAAFSYYILSRRARKLPLFGSVARNWDEEQLASLAAAEEFDLLEQYKRALAEREKARAE